MPSPPELKNAIIIAGAYDRLLYGLSFDFQSDAADADSGQTPPFKLMPEFIYPSHLGCIKALAQHGRYLVSGSTDEIIKIYDLKVRKEIGTLMVHDGSITSLKFWGKFLISAAEDGKVLIYRTSDWELCKTLQGHKTAVKGMDVHPSGKILLSVGKDRSLKCWDMMTGKEAYSLRVGPGAEQVKWISSDDFTGFMILNDKTIDVWDMQTSNISCTIKHKSRILAIAYTRLFDQDIIICGGEDKSLYFYAVSSMSSVTSTTETEIQPLFKLPNAHNTRIKDMDIFDSYMATCSSDGDIKVWSLSSLSLASSGRELEGDLKCVAEYKTDVRLTCISFGVTDTTTVANAGNKTESSDVKKSLAAKTSSHKTGKSHDENTKTEKRPSQSATTRKAKKQKTSA